MARNLVVCLDGTSNEPESGTTNVARTYAAAVKSESQLVYYDPGVGTMGARGAVTSTGKKATRVAGLVVGFGVKDNIEEAYTWLSTNYQRGDRIFVFGFSRGAYTARAGTAMSVGTLTRLLDHRSVVSGGRQVWRGTWWSAWMARATSRRAGRRTSRARTPSR